jgi:hypothetical protein
LTPATTAAGAPADILSTSTGYGGTTDKTPGGHGTLTVGGEFNYSSASEDLKRVVVDFPAGGFGNPNAIPYADRCTRGTFDTAQCDPKSQIGVVNLTVSLGGGSTLPLTGQLYEIQTTPEVPTIVGAYVQPQVGGSPVGTPIRAYAKFYPVTSGPDGDFRIRSVTEDFPRNADLGGGLILPIQIIKYEQVIWGRLLNNTPFITNPTRCDTWMSYGYVEAYDATSNADSDPIGDGKTFLKLPDVPTQPVCDTLAPFAPTGTGTFGTAVRGGHPQFDATVAIPGLAGDPVSAAVPKTVATTLPDAVNVDIKRIAVPCENAAFDARACPASTRVGSLTITNPTIVAGLSGDVYIVRRADGKTGLPDLGLVVRGAINFNLRATNSYTGPNGTQIKTTFDNTPQVGFSTLKLRINGGGNGLLQLDECPASGRNPVDSGPVTYDFTSYQGQKLTTTSPSYKPPTCFSSSVRLRAQTRCLKKRSVHISPTFRSRGEVRKVTVSIKGQGTKRYLKSPFRMTVPLNSKLKKGRSYKYVFRTYFNKQVGQTKAIISTKKASFRLCR